MKKIALLITITVLSTTSFATLSFIPGKIFYRLQKSVSLKQGLEKDYNAWLPMPNGRRYLHILLLNMYCWAFRKI